MAELVRLPPSVEKMLRSLPPLNVDARRQLASLGEEVSLQLLQKFGNISDYISFMATVSESVSSQDSVSFGNGNGNGDSPGPQNSAISSDDEYVDSLCLEGDTDFPPSNLHRQMNLNASSSQNPNIPNSPQLACLSELEFRKAFLILSYCGKKRLEDVITVESIQRLKHLPMTVFEADLWRLLGEKCIDIADRQKKLEWDSGRTYLYYCHVNPDGSYFFKGPSLNKQKTHLQRVLGDDNVLQVRFAEITDENNSVTSSISSYAGYEKIRKDGIAVGLRLYHYFVHKDGGKDEKKKNPTSSPVKCYFVCLDSNAFDKIKPYILFEKSIYEARSVFMHVHTVATLAKYMARFSLILSKTVKLEVDLSSVHIQRIKDKPCQDAGGHIVYNEDGEALIHTDGTGFISEDLALKCPSSVLGGNRLGEFEKSLARLDHEGKLSYSIESKFHTQEPPLLIQFRLFNNGLAVKGTVLLNKKLPPNTIQIRPSMIKVEVDPAFSHFPSANSFEIVSTSNQPRKTSYLSKYLITLLNYGGVPRDYFLDLLNNALAISQNAHYSKRAALTVSVKYGEMDDFLLPRMILSGIPLDEPYMQSRLSQLMREERKGLQIGKIPIKECYYLMGTTDPTGMLEADEVCIIVDDGQVSGKVLVYKHPGLHFGDVHILTATYVEDLEKFVGNAKYAIFFPTKGPRSLADEMANSDFDGDMYWVSRNPQLLEFYKPSKPWKRPLPTKSVSVPKPSHYSPEELENELWKQFLTTRFCPSNNMSYAADSWLAFMDRLLTLGDECTKEKDSVKEKILQLVDKYYDALDAPKTGKKVAIPMDLKADKFPHYMERPNSYFSKSVLGLIYETVKAFKIEELAEEVWQLPCFSGEVPARYMELWKGYYNEYKDEMSKAMRLDCENKDDAANDIIQKYKEILYGAKEFELSLKNSEDIFKEAIAIYQISYDYAKKKGVGKCNFAWKVAGRALCTLHATKQDSDTILCVKSVLGEVFN